MPSSPSPQATLPPAQPATARSQQPPLSAQQPAYSFTVPSLHDDASLACRIYHPRDLLADEEDEGKGCGRKRRKAAVLAHPYAPLGGSYDDPVVGNVGAELLAAGWVVGTFCFRGAHASSGHHGVGHRHAAESSHSAKTSWLGKPELQDYVSFVGLMVEYMRCLHADQHERASSRDSAAPRTSLDASRTPGEEHSGHENEDESMYLILGGYSYGSLVASRLSPLPVLLSPFYSSAPAPPGSTPAEILLRAQHLAAETIAERRERGRDAFNKRRSPVTIGGEESDPEARRRSKEATRRSSRSLDLARGTEKLRRAWDKKHHHSGTSSPEPAVVEDSDEARQESGNSDEGGGGIGLMPPCRPAYLLISPLLPPTSLFIAPALATQGLPALSGLQFAAGLFGGRSQHAAASRSGGDAPVDPLLRCPTLAIWGEDDSFTSSKRLVRWAKGMQEEASSMSSGRPGVGNQLGFQGVAVEGASHFWQERGVMARLRAEVREWAGRIG